MKNKILSILLIMSVFVFADSPLTSIEFYKGYIDEYPEIKRVSETAKLTDSDFKFLFSKEIPVSARLAMVNAIGFLNKNSDAFYDYAEKNETKERNLEDDILLIKGYMLAVENYSNNEYLSIIYLGLSLIKDKTHESFYMIYSMIEGQINMDRNWCGVYAPFSDKVKKDKIEVFDLNDKARKEIYDYINLYKEYCVEGDDLSKEVQNNFLYIIEIINKSEVLNEK